jgi:hypothetical protein
MKTKTQKFLRVLIFLVAMLGLVACQNGGDQNSNNMPAPATTYTKTPTPLPSPTSLPPTATPTMIPPEFVPRYMLLSPPYFSTMLLGTQCNYQKDSWNKQSAYMAYACPDLDVPWLSVRFSTLEEGQTAFDLFGKKPGEGSVLIPSGELFSEYKNLTISGRIENTEYAYFMLYETDQFVISAEAFFPEDTSNTLETFFPGKGDVVLNAVLETILGKANNIISPPEPTPMASDQQMMHGQISDWLVTEKEATDFYQGATDMFGDSFDGTWLSLGDDVDLQRESICREFVDWTNEDAPLVRFFNCIYYVGPDYDLEHILTDRPYAISLTSAFEYPKQHLIFVHDNGRYTALSAFILQDDFLFYFSLSSRSLGGQTAEDVFTEFNDRFIYNVMITNLDRFSLENVNYFSSSVYDDPFIGTWVSVDPGDGSNQQLTISYNNGVYNLIYFDEIAGSCGLDGVGNPIAADGTGTGNANGNILSTDFSLLCLSDPKSFLATVHVDYTYDESSDTLTDRGPTTWSRR